MPDPYYNFRAVIYDHRTFIRFTTDNFDQIGRSQQLSAPSGTTRKLLYYWSLNETARTSAQERFSLPMSETIDPATHCSCRKSATVSGVVAAASVTACWKNTNYFCFFGAESSNNFSFRPRTKLYFRKLNCRTEWHRNATSEAFSSGRDTRFRLSLSYTSCHTFLTSSRIWIVQRMFVLFCSGTFFI